MSEQKHTPEPWVIVAKGDEAEGVDYFINQEKDCSISGLIASWLSREDARRIVACVNACVGVSNDALFDIAKLGGVGAAIVDAAYYQRQRDQLVSTLAHIVEYWNRDQNESAMADALWHIIGEAEAAIAAVEQSC